MNENVISGGALDETVALRVVEPLHFPLFAGHILVDSFSLIDFLVRLSQPLAQNEKGHKTKDFVASTSVVTGHKN